MKILSLSLKNVLLRHNQLLWLMLAFHAGYLNAGGFLACHRFVSHMTGFGTQVGMSLGAGDFLIGLEMLLVPLFFIFGATTAGVLIDRKIEKGKEPKVIKGMGIIILVETVIYLGGVGGLFGPFGEPLMLQRDFILLFSLVYICGLQNGLFVTLTDGQIRTTHITGLATDIGLNLIRIISMKKNSAERILSRKKNFLRLKAILSFSSGSLISALIFQQAEYQGFMVSIGLAIIILTYILYLRGKLHPKIANPGREKLAG